MAFKGGSRFSPYGKKGGASASDNPDEGRMLYIAGVPLTAEWQEVKDHLGQAGNVEFVQMLQKIDGMEEGVSFVRMSTPQEAQNVIALLNGSTMNGRNGNGGCALQIDLWTGAKPDTQKGSLRPGGCKGGGRASMGMGMGMGMGQGGWNAGQQGMFLTMEQIQQLMSGNSMCLMGGGMMAGGMMSGGMMGVGAGKGMHGGAKVKVRVENMPPGIHWQELKDHFRQVGSVEFCNVAGGVGEVRFNTVTEAKKAVNFLNGSMLGDTVIMVSEW